METLMRTTHLINKENNVLGTIAIPKDYYGLVQFGNHAYEYKEDHGGGYVWRGNYEDGEPIYNVGSIILLNTNAVLIP